MFVITASDEKYKEILDITHLQFDVIWNLGGLGMGCEWKPRPKSNREIRRWKPRYMLKSLKVYEKPLVWVDADSVVVDSLAEMETDDYDLGLVVRKKEGAIKFKSATLFVRNTPGAKKFLERWIQVIPPNGRGDQIYLREIVRQYYPLTVATYKNHPILDIDGSRIKLLDRSTYCWEIKRLEYMDKVPPWAKVVHFSGWSGARKHREKMEIFREYMRRRK